MKNKTLWIIGGVVVLIILISVFSGSSNNTNTQSPVSETNQNNSSDQSVDFKKVSLANLPTDGGSLVETQGTITQKGEYTYSNQQTKTNSTSYYLKIEDSGAIVLVMPKENILANFKIGDLISVRGAVGTLGNCATPDDPQVQKLCQQFKLTSINTQIIIPIKVPPTNQDIVVLKKSTSNTTDSVTKSSYVVEAPKPVAQPTIPLTYSQIMNGLSGTLTMGEFTSGNNHGYSADNTNLLVVFNIFGTDKQNISQVSLSLMDPSVGYDSRLVNFPSDFSQYKTLHDKILAQLLTNIFPSWADRVEWVNGAVATCKQGTAEQTTTIIKNSMTINVGCSKTLGSYYVEIKHN